jgi:hypothetical protein
MDIKTEAEMTLKTGWPERPRERLLEGPKALSARVRRPDRTPAGANAAELARACSEHRGGLAPLLATSGPSRARTGGRRPGAGSGSSRGR